MTLIYFYPQPVQAVP